MSFNLRSLTVKTRFIIILLGCVCGPLQAQPPDQPACYQIADESERLDCYDKQNLPLEEPSSSPVDEWDRHISQTDDARFSLLNDRWELDINRGRFVFRPYKPVYFFPLFYSSDVNRLPGSSNPRTTVTEPINLDHTESKFQLSFKTKLGNDLLGQNGDLWLGYTQTSRWQIYNSNESRPFRETNHEPEFIFTWRTNTRLLGFKARLLSLSLNHQSNGQDEPLSRSWNRIILTVGLDRPDWVVMFRPWWRIPETSNEEDENPDIQDFVGRAEFLVVHRKGNSHQISTRIRHSLRDGEEARGSIELNWSYPCFDRLRCHAQVFDGYGESLIDYNHSSTAIGLGVDLIEWF